MRVSATSPFARATNSASTWITLSFVNQNLRHRLMPRPKFGRSHSTTAPAAPAAIRLVQLQVVGREQMTIAAGIGYGHRLEGTFEGKAHHPCFGCSKARPRYQFPSSCLRWVRSPRRLGGL